MTTLFRLEDPLGIGPYQSLYFTDTSLKRDWLDIREDLHYAHGGENSPTPYTDGCFDSKFYLEDNWFVAMPTLEWLKYWFRDGWYGKLVRVGFQAVEVTVPEQHVKRGRLQAVYNNDYAEKRIL